jgi:predicted phosphodiesterase
LKNGKTIKLLSVSDAVESTLDQRVDAELKKNVDLIVSCGDLPPEYLSRLSAATMIFVIKRRGRRAV